MRAQIRKFWNQVGYGLMAISGMSFVLLTAIGVSTTSCMQDETWNLDNVDTTVNVTFELAAPIAKGEITVLEAINKWGIIDTSEFKFDSDSLLYFEKWNDFVVNKFIKVDIPDQDTLIEFKASPVPFLFELEANEKYKLDTFDFIFHLDVSGGEIYKAILETGRFGIEGVRGFGDNPDVLEKYTVIIPDLLKKDGSVFKHTFNGAEFDGSKSFPIDDHQMSFITEGSKTNILIRIVYSVTNITDHPVSVDISTPIKFSFTINDVLASYVEGFLDPKGFVHNTEQINFPLLSPDYLQDSAVFFYDPKIEVFLQNSVGVPFAFILNEVKVINSQKKDSVDLDYKKDTIFIQPATAQISEEVIDVVPSEYLEVIDRDSSNIEDILLKVYNKVQVSYNFIPNPKGRPLVTNFLKVNEPVQLEVKTHTVVPLWAKVDQYLYRDTIDFDFQTELVDQIEDDTASLNSLDSLVLILNIDNRFPVSLSGQLYMLDENNQMVDSLLVDPANKILAAAPVDENGRSNGISKSRIVLLYGEDEINKWKDGRKIIFDVKGNTREYKYVRAYVNQGVNYTLGFYFKATLDNHLLNQ